MIFSKEYLDTVSHYEVNDYWSTWHMTYMTTVTLHFKKWWKPRKKISLMWPYESTTDRWHEGQEILQLRQCLFNYFSEK